MVLRTPTKGDSGSLPYLPGAGRFGDGDDGDSDGDGDGDGDEEDGDGEGEENTPPAKKGEKTQIDFEKLDPEVQKYIKSLRKENGKFRTKARDTETRLSQLNQRLKKMAGGEEGDDELTPEERAQVFEAQAHNQALETSILHLAYEHEVPKDSLKYFRFLISEAMAELDEGEELDDDRLAELAQEAAAKGTAKKAAKTSVTKSDGTAGNGKKDPDGVKDEVTFEQFRKMTILERSGLYTKNPSLYEKHMSTLKDKRMS